MIEAKPKSWERSHAFRLPGENRGPGLVAVTWCTHERRLIQADKTTISKALDEDLAKSSRDGHAKVVVVCVMPDHVHLMLSMDGQGAALWEYVKVWKGLWTKRLTQEQGKQFWQRTFYDHWMRRDEGRKYASYIVGNPVRKGFVKDWREYPYTRVYMNFL